MRVDARNNLNNWKIKVKPLQLKQITSLVSQTSKYFFMHPDKDELTIFNYFYKRLGNTIRHQCTNYDEALALLNKCKLTKIERDKAYLKIVNQTFIAMLSNFPYSNVIFKQWKEHQARSQLPQN